MYYCLGAPCSAVTKHSCQVSMFLIRTYTTRKKGAFLDHRSWGCRSVSLTDVSSDTYSSRCLDFVVSIGFLVPLLNNLHDLVSLLMISSSRFASLLSLRELVKQAGDTHSSPQPNECGNHKRNFRVSGIIPADPWKANLKLTITTAPPTSTDLFSVSSSNLHELEK